MEEEGEEDNCASVLVFACVYAGGCAWIENMCDSYFKYQNVCEIYLAIKLLLSIIVRVYGN